MIVCFIHTDNRKADIYHNRLNNLRLELFSLVFFKHVAYWIFWSAFDHFPHGVLSKLAHLLCVRWLDLGQIKSPFRCIPLWEPYASITAQSRFFIKAYHRKYIVFFWKTRVLWKTFRNVNELCGNLHDHFKWLLHWFDNQFMLRHFQQSPNMTTNVNIVASELHLWQP